MQNLRSITKLLQKKVDPASLDAFFPIYTATLVFLGGIGFLGLIWLAWLLGEETVTAFFAQLQFWQDHPPSWLAIPHFSHVFYLFLPTLILFVFLQTILKLSPYPQTWSRFLIASILLTLLIRYVIWRSLTTLNLSNPVDGFFSISLWLSEMVVMLGEMISLSFFFTFKERRQEANQYAQAVLQKNYQPLVDILIPTYDEPELVLKRTIIGCQAINYQNKKIYLLDDTKRPQIKKLAQELGCYYISRPDNRYAKAGNLNYAIAKTQGELITVFDADFIPTKNFLNRLVGFFQNPKIALVQTPQSFYNFDPIARNLGLETRVTAEEEIFHRQSQLLKDGAKCVVCSGSSFVVRRQHLEEVGNFVTESISEDYFTGINLSAKGYEVIYLNEKLSAGLTAESIPAYITQRLRWTRGTLQALFIKANPLTITGLSIRQRMGHLLCLLTWFYVMPRLFFMIMPFFYFLFGIVSIRVSWQAFVFMFLPYYVAQMSMFYWLSLRSRSIVFSEIYALVSFIPIAVTIVKIILNPFQEKFRVTPKGTYRNQYIYNWKLAIPLIILFALTGLGLLLSFKNINFSIEDFKDLNLIWGIYNLFFLSITLLALLDKPKSESYESFSLKYPIELKVNNQCLSARTEMLSERGAEISLTEKVTSQQSVSIRFLGEDLEVKGYIGEINNDKSSYRIKVDFEKLDLQQDRKLIELIYCEPGRWINKNAPGELQSLGILLKILGQNIIALFTQKKIVI